MPGGRQQSMCSNPPDRAGSSIFFQEADCPGKGTEEGGYKLVLSAASLTREGKPKPQVKMALLSWVTGGLSKPCPGGRVQGKKLASVGTGCSLERLPPGPLPSLELLAFESQRLA